MLAELSTKGLVHPPLPIPSPPAFEVSPQTQAGKAQSSQPKEEEARALHAVESQNSGTQAQSAAAAKRALPDDNDFAQNELVCNLHSLWVQGFCWFRVGFTLAYVWAVYSHIADKHW